MIQIEFQHFSKFSFIHVDETEKSHDSKDKESKEFSSKEQNYHGKEDYGKIKKTSFLNRQEKLFIVAE